MATEQEEKERREERRRQQWKILQEVFKEHKYLMENDPEYRKRDPWLDDLVTFGRDTDD